MPPSLLSQVQVVSDDFTVVGRDALYGSSREEKMARGTLRSAAERHLTQGEGMLLLE